MTAVPSRGLLPQLTDVLHALTDSHERLLCKLRSLHLEDAMTSAGADEEETPHAEFLDIADRRLNAIVEPLVASYPSPQAAAAARVPTPLVEVESTRPHAPRAVDVAAAIDEPSDRDYNYFDELDARLADLGKSDAPPLTTNPSP